MSDGSARDDTGSTGSHGASNDEAESTSQYLMRLMKEKLGLSDEKPDKVLDQVDIEGIVKYIKSGKCKKIVTMAGAGISTSAGIPDFRSPGTGLYDNLQKYNLPSPQAIFDIGFFRENPEPFFQLAKELWPGTFKPTVCHYFLRLLEEHGVLLRHYTQNIDTLEHVAGLSPDKIVEAHGTFHTSHCVTCGASYTQEWIKEKIFADTVPHCEKDECLGLVKPDIVFFGEALPTRFVECVQSDMGECDLLIVMGTSLVVQPFASLTNRVPKSTPRLVINLEKPEGGSDPFMMLLGMGHGFDFDGEDNYRDVFHQNTCDDGCMTLAEKLGWKDELDSLVKKEHSRIDEESNGAGGLQPMPDAEEKQKDQGSKDNKTEAPAKDDAPQQKL